MSGRKDITFSVHLLVLSQPMGFRCFFSERLAFAATPVLMHRQATTNPSFETLELAVEDGNRMLQLDEPI